MTSATTNSTVTAGAGRRAPIRAIVNVLISAATAVAVLAIVPLANASGSSIASASGHRAGLTAAANPSSASFIAVSNALGTLPDRIALTTSSRPTITKTTPRNGATNLSRTVQIRVTFSVPIHGQVWLTDLTSGACVPEQASSDSRTLTATISPLSPLAANHTYRVRIQIDAGTSGLQVPAANFTVIFSTGSK